MDNPVPAVPKAGGVGEMLPRWSNEALARLAVAENEIIELQQAILARGNSSGHIELAVLTRLRALLLLVADTRYFLLYDLPAMGTSEMQAHFQKILQELRSKFEHASKRG